MAGYAVKLASFEVFFYITYLLNVPKMLWCFGASN